MLRGVGVVLALALGTLAGCGHQIPLAARPGVQGIEGKVTVVNRDYGVRVVELSIDELVDPRMFAPTARTYVVWAQRDGVDCEQVGVLRREDDRGRLEAVVPSADFHLFVTAESSEATRTPTGQPIFFADVTADPLARR